MGGDTNRVGAMFPVATILPSSEAIYGILDGVLGIKYPECQTSRPGSKGKGSGTIHSRFPRIP